LARAKSSSCLSLSLGKEALACRVYPNERSIWLR